MDLLALKNELTAGHPTTGDYSANDVTAAAQLNAPNRTVEKTQVSGSEIANAIVPGEFDLLTAVDQERVRWVTQLGDAIDVRTGTNVRGVLLSLFGEGTTTRSSLAALVNHQVSRAVELRLGTVHHLHVAEARKL